MKYIRLSFVLSLFLSLLSCTGSQKKDLASAISVPVSETNHNEGQKIVLSDTIEFRLQNTKHKATYNSSYFYIDTLLFQNYMVVLKLQTGENSFTGDIDIRKGGNRLLHYHGEPFSLGVEPPYVFTNNIDEEILFLFKNEDESGATIKAYYFDGKTMEKLGFIKVFPENTANMENFFHITRVKDNVYIKFNSESAHYEFYESKIDTDKIYYLYNRMDKTFKEVKS